MKGRGNSRPGVKRDIERIFIQSVFPIFRCSTGQSFAVRADKQTEERRPKSSPFISLERNSEGEADVGARVSRYLSKGLRVTLEPVE